MQQTLANKTVLLVGDAVDRSMVQQLILRNDADLSPLCPKLEHMYLSELGVDPILLIEMLESRLTSHGDLQYNKLKTIHVAWFGGGGSSWPLLEGDNDEYRFSASLVLSRLKKYKEDGLELRVR